MHHRWLGDLGLVGLAALLGGLFFVDSLTSEPQGRRLGLELAFGALACAALLLRRRWPVALAVALTPMLMLSPLAMGATAVALYAVATVASWRVTAAVATGHALLVTAVFGLLTPDRQTFWQGVLVVLALDAALIASGLTVRSRRLLVHSLAGRAREAEERHRLRIEEARHTERERIAREMHDALAHRISLLAVHAGALAVRRSAPAAEQQAAEVIRRCAHQALEDLREVIGMLRDPAERAGLAPDGPDAAGLGPAGTDRAGTDRADPQQSDADRPQPTLAALPDLIDQSRQAGTLVTFETDLPEPGSVPTGIGRHVYRIVQEGLTNARKHAPDAPVRVTVLRVPQDGLAVEITNPTAGPDRPPTAGRLPGAGQLPGAGSGLIGLRERATLAGGQIEHGPADGDEFRLRAWLPWPS